MSKKEIYLILRADSGREYNAAQYTSKPEELPQYLNSKDDEGNCNYIIFKLSSLDQISDYTLKLTE